MKRKIVLLAAIFTLIICTTLLSVSTSFAVSNKGISSAADTVERGSTVVIMFTIGAQTKGVSDLTFKFTFDNSAFELTDYTIPEIAGAEKSVADIEKANHIAVSNTNGFAAFGYNSSDGEASITLSETYAAFTFKAKEDAAFGTFSFTVSDYDIGSLDNSGLPDAICDISSLTSAEKTVSVKITEHKAADASLKLNKNTLSLDVGESETLEAAVVSDDEDKSVVWKSSDESVAAVDSNGKVTAVKNGIATITAAAGSLKDTCVVTVSCIHDFIEKADIQYLVSAATCVSPAVYYKSCSKCGLMDSATFTYGDIDFSKHIESSEWEHNDTEHWKICTVPECGAILDKASHTASEWIIDNEATESTEGSKHRECSVCGMVLETAEIEKTSSASNNGNIGNIFLWIALIIAIIVGGAVAAIIGFKKKKSDKLDKKE